MSSAAKVSIIVGVLSLCQLAFGQSRHSSGGRDDNRPLSNDEIAQRVARTRDFLQRTDTNHNGMIDADEAGDGMAKGYLDRIFSRLGRQPQYPISIAEIMQGYEAYYRTRGTTSGGGSPSSGGSSPAASWTLPPGMGFGSPVVPAPGGSFSNPSPSRPVITGMAVMAGTNLTASPPLEIKFPPKPRCHCRPRHRRQRHRPQRHPLGMPSRPCASQLAF